MLRVTEFRVWGSALIRGLVCRVYGRKYSSVLIMSLHSPLEAFRAFLPTFTVLTVLAVLSISSALDCPPVLASFVSLHCSTSSFCSYSSQCRLEWLSTVSQSPVFVFPEGAG